MKKIRKTSRLDNVGYEIRGPVAEEAARMARDGIEIVELNTGNPAAFGFFAPKTIEDALRENIRNSESYSSSYGLPDAIEAIKKYSESKGIEGISHGEIFTGNGVSELISISLTALINEGDEVLIPLPDYPLWTSAAALCGGVPVGYVCDESADWMPDADDIRKKITPRTKAIVIINPNNPTGAVYDKDNLLTILEIARQNELVVFSDEIYDRLLYDGEVHHSCAALAPDLLTVTFNGLSKSHMLAGFRCGWIIISGDCANAADYIEGVRMLASMRLCANVLAQSVVKTALDDAHFAAPLLAPGGRLYEQRELIYSAINDIPGLSAIKPRASFYIFPRIDTAKFKITDDERFVIDFLHKHHVLMTQGRGFNWPHPDHFRIVYLPQVDVLAKLTSDLRSFLQNYSQS